MDAHAQTIRNWFEQLSPAALAQLPHIYREDAQFKDPFNEVQGHAAIARIFEHMFAVLVEPRFTVLDLATQGPNCFMTWQFGFRRKGGTSMSLRGATHFVLAEDGRIAVHRDYWDAAEELYEKLPGIGMLLRALRRRLAAKA